MDPEGEAPRGWHVHDEGLPEVFVPDGWVSQRMWVYHIEGRCDLRVVRLRGSPRVATPFFVLSPGEGSAFNITTDVMGTCSTLGEALRDALDNHIRESRDRAGEARRVLLKLKADRADIRDGRRAPIV